MTMALEYSTTPYPSARSPLFAPHGVVATSQPLAAQAGLHMLQRGGNAVDAAIAVAAALTVVEPTSNGIGSDAFALVWDGTRLHGLNGSGRAPAGLSPEHIRRHGHEVMPSRGWLPVTVPGAPAAWRDLHRRFGKLPFAVVFEPAIGYAEQGFPLSPVLAHYWQSAYQSYRSAAGAEFAGWAATFATGGSAPRVGETWRSAGHAHTLSRIAATEADDFYRGEIAATIVDFAARTGGFLTADDLDNHTTLWVDPISTDYHGYEVWEIPPNGQGLAALLALNLLEHYDLRSLGRESELAYHLQIEAIKLAFADAQRYIADPEHVTVPTAELLSKTYAAERRKLIGQHAGAPMPGEPLRGGTVYLGTADDSGMMVSFIQSNYMGFGSGIVVPGTGIALQNRGAGFSLQAGHPNELAPGKRPFHTIIPAFLTHGGAPIGPFGVMGGHMQPQGHVQMVLNTLDWQLNPQSSLDAPRWYWEAGRDVLVERGVAASIVEALRRRGHHITLPDSAGPFGRGQIIWRQPGGTYVAGSDGRTDGAAVGY